MHLLLLLVVLDCQETHIWLLLDHTLSILS